MLPVYLKTHIVSTLKINSYLFNFERTKIMIQWYYVFIAQIKSTQDSNLFESWDSLTKLKETFLLRASSRTTLCTFQHLLAGLMSSAHLAQSHCKTHVEPQRSRRNKHTCLSSVIYLSSEIFVANINNDCQSIDQKKNYS